MYNAINDRGDEYVIIKESSDTMFIQMFSFLYKFLKVFLNILKFKPFLSSL